MASNEQENTFTVPVSTRLSYGVELELLVAYMYTSDDCPDEPDDLNLPPVLVIESKEPEECEWYEDADAIRKHVRTTLRDYGIRVFDEVPNESEDPLPFHLQPYDFWSVVDDPSVGAGEIEVALHARGPKKYKWCGLEVQSRVFRDAEHAYDEIRFVVNLLKAKYRLRVNVSCGLHVHVGDGANYWDTNTLKRAGAFLWAADPILSRLHAPWRRVGEYSSSIRYRSRLARNDAMKAEDIQEYVDREAAGLQDRSNGAMTMNPLPVLPWSDTSMQEAALGGKAELEEYARRRVQNGPFLTVPERLPSPRGRSRSSRYASSDSEQSSSYSSSSSSSGTNSDYSVNNPGNLGGAYDRLFQSVIVSDRVRDMCYRKYGHRDVLDLPSRAQYQLFLIEACDQLYGHTKVERLPDDQYEDLICECAPYTQTVRSHYSWDEGDCKFKMNSAKIGRRVEGPRARKYNNVDPSLAVVRLQEIADEMDGEVPDDVVFDYASDDEEDLSGEVDDWERFLMFRLDQLMDQPTFPLHCVDRLVAEVKKLKEYAGMLSAPPSVASSAPASENGDDSSGDFNPFAFEALDEGRDNKGPNVPRPPTPPGSANGRLFNRRSSDHEPGLRGGYSRDNNANSSSSPTSSTYDPSRDPAFFTSRDSSPSSSSFHSSEVSLPLPLRTKLQPHDVYSLPKEYIKHVTDAALLSAEHWQRVAWLPDPNPHHHHRRGAEKPDPMENHARHSVVCAGPECREHVVTTTRRGIEAILAVDSAAALGVLLGAPGEYGLEDEHAQRLNYNFKAYAPFVLANKSSTEKRTIEFREAGGSLDAEWIVAWSKICVGIMRFCRDCSPSEYVRVLERVVRQEERMKMRDGNGGGGVRYDVCDLLEDLCLFGEAAFVRRRERELGPPR
ncbi:hypothetical protein F5Y08DRAFT_350915 [Xylaria arbuscula]|nr:hypothetical protein F5Y08DRAFT_350915 [Xylaria arbuscula]